MTKFLGIWEQLNNPDFKPVEFDGIRMQTGLNSFTLDRMDEEEDIKNRGEVLNE